MSREDERRADEHRQFLKSMKERLIAHRLQYGEFAPDVRLWAERYVNKLEYLTREHLEFCVDCQIRSMERQIKIWGCNRALPMTTTPCGRCKTPVPIPKGMSHHKFCPLCRGALGLRNWAESVWGASRFPLHCPGPSEADDVAFCERVRRRIAENHQNDSALIETIPDLLQLARRQIGERTIDREDLVRAMSEIIYRQNPAHWRPPVQVRRLHRCRALVAKAVKAGLIPNLTTEVVAGYAVPPPWRKFDEDSIFISEEQLLAMWSKLTEPPPQMFGGRGENYDWIHA